MKRKLVLPASAPQSLDEITELYFGAGSKARNEDFTGMRQAEDCSRCRARKAGPTTGWFEGPDHRLHNHTGHSKAAAYEELERELRQDIARLGRELEPVRLQLEREAERERRIQAEVLARAQDPDRPTEDERRVALQMGVGVDELRKQKRRERLAREGS